MQEESQGLKLAIKTHWQSLNQAQKTFFVVFVLVGIGVLAFSYLSVREGVYAPFRVSLEDIRKNRDLLKDPTAEQEAIDKRTDTDGDGISDWDEANKYHTSPYLWSTAGDDVPDNVKIALGANPLCKLGEECTAQSMNYNLPTSTYPMADVAGTNLNQSLGEMLMGDNTVGENFRDTASQAGMDLSLDSVVPRDPAVLRQALLQTGKVTAEQLDAIDDNQLLQYFDEAEAELKQQNPSLNGTSTAAISPSGSTADRSVGSNLNPNQTK